MSLPPTWSAHLLSPDHHRAGQHLDSHLTSPDDAGPHAWAALRRVTDHERRSGVTQASRQARAMLALNLHVAWHEGGHLAAARLLAGAWNARLYLRGPDYATPPTIPTADLLLSQPLSGLVSSLPAATNHLSPGDATLRQITDSYAMTLAASYSPCPYTPALPAHLSSEDETLLAQHPPPLRDALLREAAATLRRAADPDTWRAACDQAARDLLRNGQILCGDQALHAALP